MLTAPTWPTALSHPQIFNQALSKAYQVGHRYHKRYDVCSSAAAIWSRSGVLSGCEEHAQRDEKVSEYLGVRSEHICHEDVSEFSIFWFRQSTYGYPFERGQRPIAAGSRERLDWYDEGEHDEEEVEVRQRLPGKDRRGGAAGDEEEEEPACCQRYGQEGG